MMTCDICATPRWKKIHNMTHIRIRLLRELHLRVNRSSHLLLHRPMIFHLRLEYWQTCCHSGDIFFFFFLPAAQVQRKKKTLQGFKALERGQLTILAQALNLHKLSLLYNAWRVGPLNFYPSLKLGEQTRKQSLERHPIEFAQAYEMSFLLAQP